MTAWWLAFVFTALPDGVDHPGVARLPICSNRTINEVVKRAGCTLGDARCWRNAGGHCMDHVDARMRARGIPDDAPLESIQPGDVAPGDVAVFAARAHYAHVDRVIRDPAGRAVAVDVSEFNFGTCWIDRSVLVTDRYGVVSRRAGVPLGSVDGGFLRARSAAGTPARVPRRR